MSDVKVLGDGRFLISDDAGQRVAYGVASGSTRWVFLDGRTYVLTESSGSRSRAPHDDDLALVAPMPATVATINVKAGQQVAQGDVLIVLEAMKMELPIKAPRDGRIRAISCREGELVQPGVRLLDLE